MTVLSGPKLDKMAKELSEWYITTRTRLIEALEEGYPYGSVLLDPRGQLEDFLNKTPEDWEKMFAGLALRYRGQPDADQRIQSDVMAYLERMSRIMQGGGTT